MRRPIAVLVAAAALTSSRAASSADDDPWIARDKAFHFGASAGIASLTYSLSAGWLVDSRGKALAIGGGVALAAGAGKELLDMTGIGTPSWRDFAWDVIGTVAGLALAWGIDLALGGVDAKHPAFGSPKASPQSGSLVVVRF